MLEVYSKASGVPTTATYRLSVSFMNGATLVNKVTKNIAKGTHDFVPVNRPAGGTGAYDCIVVKIF